MDVLSDVLLAVRLTGAVFFDVEARSPFATESPAVEAIADRVMAGAGHVISFHTMMEGACWAEVIGRPAPPVHLRAGETVVYPLGDANILASAPGMRGQPDVTQYSRPPDRLLPFPLQMNPDAGAEKCRFVCGFLGCDSRPFNPLLSALPCVVHAPISTASRGWLASLIGVAVKESGHQAAGREAMLAKLAELMFVEVMRSHIDSLPEDARGWFAGLRDPQIGAALRLIHGRPTAPWTSRHARSRNRTVAIVPRRAVHRLCANATDAVSGAMASADRRPSSRSAECQRRAGRGRGGLSVGSGVQPRLQTTHRHRAGSMATRAGAREIEDWRHWHTMIASPDGRIVSQTMPDVAIRPIPLREFNRTGFANAAIALFPLSAVSCAPASTQVGRAEDKKLALSSSDCCCSSPWSICCGSGVQWRTRRTPTGSPVHFGRWCFSICW